LKKSNQKPAVLEGAAFVGIFRAKRENIYISLSKSTAFSAEKEGSSRSKSNALSAPKKDAQREKNGGGLCRSDFFTAVV
jgi:hypothetical protein